MKDRLEEETEEVFIVELTADECTMIYDTIRQCSYAGEYAELVAGVKEKVAPEVDPDDSGPET